MSVTPSAAPSVAHYREESRTTYEDQIGDESMSLVQRSQTTTRHVPRKLSLVDRYDSVSRGGPRGSVSPPDVLPSSQALSPIYQADEPPSAKKDLENRVRSWRASASLLPTLLATTGQTSLEPANMPNTVPLDDSLVLGNDDLDLEDFTWSISSCGPGDYDDHSIASPDRLPSVHLASRVQGSVCLTPSDCTSFGPSDYTLPSPVPSLYRLPSPDIAHRMFEDVPLTPLTATSWGPPLSYPPSPMSDYRAPSVDLAARQIFSRPCTPLTATSWGAPSYPASPCTNEYRPPLVHLADRGEYSRPATPSTATSWGAPLSYPPSPSAPYHVHSPNSGQRAFDPAETELRTKSLAFPYYDPRKGSPWGHVWPYHDPINDAPRRAPDVVQPKGKKEPSTFPYSDISQDSPWAYVWPYHRGRQIHVGDDHLPIAVSLPSTYPYLNICKYLMMQHGSEMGFHNLSSRSGGLSSL